MITSSIGATGRDYPDPQAWWDDLPATLVDDVTGECYNDAVFTSAGLFSGVDYDTFSVLLTAAAGESFVDDPSAATNPQYYDQSKGVGFSSGSFGLFQAFVATSGPSPALTIERLQFQLTAGFANYALTIDDTATVRNCIFAREYDETFSNLVFVRLGLVANCLMYQTVSNSTSMLSIGIGKAVACALINTDYGTATALQDAGFDAMETSNCAIFGFSTLRSDANGFDDYNATDAASGFNGGTNNVYSLDPTDQYVDEFDDFRLKAGNDMLAGEDTTADTSGLDIIGQSQPGSAPWYIGQWAYQSGGGITGSGNIPLPALVVAGSGSVERKGTGNILLPPLAVSGSGFVTRTGSGNILLPALQVAGVGERVVPGSGNIPLPALQVAGAGTVSDVIAGSGNTLLPALQVAGAGEITKVGSGNVLLPPLQVSGVGEITKIGTGNIPLPALQVDGSGVVGNDILGSGDIPLPALQVNGNGFRTAIGVGSILLPPLQVAGAGKKSVFGTGNVLLPALLVNGTGHGGGPSSGGDAFVGDIEGVSIEGQYEIEGPSVEGVRGGIF